MEENREKKLVVTIDGTKACRTECRYIKGAFHKVGDSTVEGSGQCYLVEGKYCRDGTGYIVYDYGKNQYVRKTDSLKEGIVDLEKDKETPIYGYFTQSEVHNVVVHLKNGSVKICLLENILKHSYYKERLVNGEFYHISKLDAKSFNKKIVPEELKYSLSYDSKGIMGKNIELYNKFNDSIPSKMIKDNASLMENLTFGLEFETTNGFIPKRITSKLGLLPLRDGSIQGLEYVTIPLQGAKGLQTVVDSCKELQKRTNFDKSCSLHLHLGGMPRTIEYITALYRVLANVQNEMYEFFPLYKQHNYGVKKKAYTKPLPTLDILPYMDASITKDNIVNNFEVIYKYFSMGQSFKSNFSSLEDVESHPSDPQGTSKWNIRSRYHWVNFIPLLFGNKQTIEFRIHTATVDYDKILNFMFICSAIINYTKKYQDKILKDYQFVTRSSIRNILGSMYDNSKIGYSLYEYLDSRRFCIQDLLHRGDIMCPENVMNPSYINWEPIPKTTKKSKSPILNASLNHGIVAQLHNMLQEEQQINIPQPQIAVEIVDVDNEEMEDEDW